MIATAVVYRAYDEDNRLLYVGFTTSPCSRMKQHSYTSPWWVEMARLEYSDWMPFAEAQAVESDLIWSLSPLYNQPHVSEQRRFRYADLTALLASSVRAS